VAACPANALELLGMSVTVEHLMSEVLKDRTFYETSGGGVTVSGGEPVRQSGFLEAFLQQLKAEGVQTALDTCGFVRWTALQPLLPHLDLILFDLKVVSGDLHRKFTGQENALILENLLRVCAAKRSGFPSLQIWIRTPLIPGATADEDVVRGIATFLADNVPQGLERWELCSFNNLCQAQYDRLGMQWQFRNVPLMSVDEISRLERIARRYGPPGLTIQATGPGRPENQED